MSEHPPFNETEQVTAVDAKPDAEYPLRILRVYLQRTEVRWQTHGLPPERSAIYDVMNGHQNERAEILRDAIRRLEETSND